MLRYKFWALVAIAVTLLAATSLAPDPANAQKKARECTTLTCAKCTSICTAACNAELKSCDASSDRGCPRNYRSCMRGCPSMLCAQCMPVQYVEGGKKFLPGKTELCRTWGDIESGKP